MIFVDEHGSPESIEASGNEIQPEAIEHLEISSRAGETDNAIEWDDYQDVSEFIGGSPSIPHNVDLHLTSAEEATLLRHFLERLGPWVSSRSCRRLLQLMLTYTEV